MSLYFTDMAHNPFLVTGLWAGFLAGISCGIVGPWVVTRRIVFLAGAIAHIAVGGVGASIYLSYRFPALFGDLHPLVGATVTAVLAAFLLARLTHRRPHNLDALIGALWSMGMAAGILLIKLTPGYQTELMAYLFGNLTLVSRSDLHLLLVLDVLVIGVACIYHKQFLALCLDPEQATLAGIDTRAAHTIMLLLVALTVITLTQVVGLLLVIALLSLPAATAARFTGSLPAAIVCSTILCALLTVIPRIAVYSTPIGPEPAIILAAGSVYGLSLLVRRRKIGSRAL